MVEEVNGYRIIPANNLIGYQIQHVGRGSLHKTLSGLFTSRKIAREKIDEYVGSRKEKEELNGEASPASRDQSIQRRSNYRRKSSNNS